MNSPLPGAYAPRRFWTQDDREAKALAKELRAAGFYARFVAPRSVSHRAPDHVVTDRYIKVAK